jgi:D-alanyl-lipoteichoic acid acyltransferase DltB (MBOAT superfamily)
MGRYSEKKKRRPFLIISLIANFGLLFFFKYYNFAVVNLNELFEALHFTAYIKASSILLPVGISFYTFQTVSYSIDVYNGKQEPEKHLGYFALYVSFFPQLVAGPIERFSSLTPQLKQNHPFEWKNVRAGLQLILYGLFIKMVIADNVSAYVDKLYESPADFNSLSIMSGLFLYSFQIYSDFSGYSTVAIGSALLLGVHLMDNFKTPYLSKNIAEFWQRWHISLSTWFRDYVYIPLGGNRVGKRRWAFNIMMVFTLSGLWHGSNWTFIFWGGFFGVIYLIEHFFNKRFPTINPVKPFSVKHLLLALKTFILVTLIWVFFRSQTISESFVVLKSLFVNGFLTGQSLNIPLHVWIFLGIFIVSDLLLYNKRFDTWTSSQNFVLRWFIYALLLFLIIACSGVEIFQFIYFQF